MFIISAFILGGLFFNFEMNIGVFIPVIIFASILLTERKYFKDKNLWLGLFIFIGTLLPQIIFDLKHQFIMSKAIIKFLSEGRERSFSPLVRFESLWNSFYQTFQATMMNHKLLSTVILILSIPVFKKVIQKKDNIVVVSLLFIIIPFLGYLIIQVTVNPWHLGGPMTASIILMGYIISKLQQINFFGKIIAFILSFFIILYSLSNITHFFNQNFDKPNSDPSLYKNEISAIDFVYKYANGQNFKVYTYLPSVYDYPYQYSFWWHGRKKYSYLPIEYSYGVGKKDYISNKDSFSAKESDIRKRKDSNLVFLIKEPNINYTRFGWEGDFISAAKAIKMESLSKQMVGPMEIEVRKEIKK